MSEIKALLFDIDGTILDTTEFIFQSTEHALSQSGLYVPPRSEIAKVVGLSFDEFYRALTKRDDNKSLQKLHADFQLKNVHLSKLYPGSLYTLETFKKRGFKIAAVSSRYRKTLSGTLSKDGILEMFDCIICGDEVQSVKPDPTSLFTALETLSILPEQSVMIGDSSVDIKAGKNAGTKTVRATYGFNTDFLNDPEPDFIIDKIEDLLTLF